MEITVWNTRFVFHVGDVIRKLRRAKKWGVIDLAERAGVNKMTISAVERGETNFQKDTIDRIAAALGYFNGADLHAMAAGQSVAPQSSSDQIDLDVSTYKRFDIPVIAEGDASPGGVFWDEEGKPLLHVDEWMSRPNDPAVRDPSCYAIVVRGDSMEPLIRRGMRLIISPNISVSDGDVAYVILKSNERLVKVIHKHVGGWVLESYNREYPPRFVSRSEVEAVHRVAYIRTLK